MPTIGDLISSHLGFIAGEPVDGATDGLRVASSCTGGDAVGTTAGEVGGVMNPEAAIESILPAVGSIGGKVRIPLRTVSSKSGLFKVNSAMSV